MESSVAGEMHCIAVEGLEFDQPSSRPSAE